MGYDGRLTQGEWAPVSIATRLVGILPKTIDEKEPVRFGTVLPPVLSYDSSFKVGRKAFGISFHLVHVLGNLLDENQIDRAEGKLWSKAESFEVETANG